MGIISEQLSTLSQELQNAKNSINSKYTTMDMPTIDSLKVNELSQKINDIPVLNTKDATASSSDIVKNKTAYANQQKVSGSLQDYRNANVSSTTVLSSNRIKVKIPEGIYNDTSNILISLNDVAKLINLDPGVIKEGVSVLGVTGTYSKPPEGNFVNYDSNANMFKFEFKWGFWELACLEEKSYVKCKMYQRIYNAYHYNGEIDGYYIEDDNTVYRPTYNHSVINYALSCYVYDLGLTIDDANEIWGKVMYDSPELLVKFASFYYTSQNGIIKYIFLDSFEPATMNNYRNICLNAFKEISNKIKTTYGITYNADVSSYGSSVESIYYSINDRVKITKVIHDWLVLNNTYGQTDYMNLDQLMYSALCKGTITPVCAGYAKAFQWCCQKFGIYTLPVLGYADGGYHMWNMICYERGFNDSVITAWDNPPVWNEVDVTWDDPTNGTPTTCKWNFFNVTTAFLETNIGGSRTRTIHPDECYRKYVSKCSCTSYRYTGNTQYGGL